jgi:hypothetical protein
MKTLITKKPLTFITHCLLVAGILYAALVIVVLPAAACTAQDCTTIDQSATYLCQGEFGSSCSEASVFCGPSGYVIQCYQPPQNYHCGSIAGQC